MMGVHWPAARTQRAQWVSCWVWKTGQQLLLPTPDSRSHSFQFGEIQTHILSASTALKLSKKKGKKEIYELLYVVR